MGTKKRHRITPALPNAKEQESMFKRKKKVEGKYPIKTLEKAITRSEVVHTFQKIELNLMRYVVQIRGFVMVDDKKINLTWSANGMAFIKGVRNRDYDLIIVHDYESVC